MLKKTQFNRLVVVFAIPSILILSLIMLSNSLYFYQNVKVFSNAIIIDLLLVIPLIYFLLIRKKNIPKTTVIPVAIVGILVGFRIIPDEYQLLLNVSKTWLIPLLELTIVTFVGYKLIKTIRLFSQEKNRSADFFTIAQKICRDNFGSKVGTFLATEIAVFYYGFMNWKKKDIKKNEFTYHKNTGTKTLLGALIFLIAVETVAVHLLLAQWNAIAAWAFSGLSIYTGFQIFGFIRSLNKRPIVIENNRLRLRYGIMGASDINTRDIAAVELSTKLPEPPDGTKYLSFLGAMEGHNVLLHLKHENTLTGLYGAKKKFSSIALFIDEKEKFVAELNNKLK